MTSRNSSTLVLVLAIGGVLVFVGLCCLGGAFGFAWWSWNDSAAMDEAFEEESRRLRDELAFREQAREEQAPLGAPAPPPLVLRGGPASDRAPRHIEATVTQVAGPIGVAPGAACSFDVEVVDSPNRPNGYWCRVRANCGGVPLYGIDRPDGTGNGYFPCDVFPGGVAGEDRGMTGEDSDPFFQIDTRAGVFFVIDDETTEMAPGAFRVQAAIRP